MLSDKLKQLAGDLGIDNDISKRKRHTQYQNNTAGHDHALAKHIGQRAHGDVFVEKHLHDQHVQGHHRGGF